jgi:hypothetical protein
VKRNEKEFCNLGNQSGNRYKNEAWKTLRPFASFSVHEKYGTTKKESLRRGWEVSARNPGSFLRQDDGNNGNARFLYAQE